MNPIKRFPLLSFFVLTYLINWIGLGGTVIGIIPTLGQWELHYQEHLIAVFRVRQTLLDWAPNFAAMIVLGVTGGSEAVKGLFRRFLLWRVGFRWWLISFLLPVFVCILVMGLYLLLGEKILTDNIKYIPMIFFLRSIFVLTTGGFGEEAGWRGLALERLQERFDPLRASILIGILWGLLHFPLWYLRGLETGYIMCYFISIIYFSIFFTWVYNRTQGSLLILAFLHNTFNAVDATVSRSFAALFLHEDYVPVFTMVIVSLGTVLLLWTKGRLGKEDT